MSKFIYSDTQNAFIAILDNSVGVVVYDNATKQRLDFYEVDLSLKDEILSIQDFNELIVFANNNDKGCIRSQIPPTVNTDNKTVATGEQVGVVDSVGDALSLYAFFSDEFDEVGLYEHPAALTQPEPINQKSFIDDDIPPSFFESGIFARAE